MSRREGQMRRRLGGGCALLLTVCLAAAALSSFVKITSHGWLGCLSFCTGLAAALKFKG